LKKAILIALRVVPATPALASHVMYFARGADSFHGFLGFTPAE